MQSFFWHSNFGGNTSAFMTLKGLERASLVNTDQARVPAVCSQGGPSAGLPHFREQHACAILSIAIWGSLIKRIFRTWSETAVIEGVRYELLSWHAERKP